MSVWRSLLIGIVSSTGVLFAPSYVGIALAQLAPQEISAIAKPITVRIDGTDEGSGVIIEESENTYTVLTNWHVVEAPGQYTIQTHDGEQYNVESNQIRKLSDEVDLALITFYSDNEYETAELGESETLGEGQTIHLAGYPGNGQIVGESDRIYRFNSLSINAILPDGREGGYSLAYGGENFSGMSGSPILDSNGNVIGINGIAYQDADGKARSNYAIPIDAYFELAYLVEDSALDSDSLSSVEDFVISKLDPIPVFTVTDERGAPLVATIDGEKVSRVFISQDDANVFLNNLKNNDPELASTVRVVPVSLGEIYKLAKVSQTQENALNFDYIPEKEAVASAKLSMIRYYREDQKPYNEGEVPLFVVKGGAEKGYLTIERDGQQVIPFFFGKQQLEELITKYRDKNPDLARNILIEVTSLEEVIKALETNNDQKLEKILLVPTEESLQFLRELKRSQS